MELVTKTRGINGKFNLWKYHQKRGGFFLVMGVMLTLFWLTFLVTPLLAKTTARKLPDMEVILKEARQTLDNNLDSPNDLRQVISLLEGYAPKFPGEVRFPLYLAEAYYRLADPSADVDREFPYYEKTGDYAQKALAIDPNQAEAHYWHALFLLKKAQKRGITGYFIVKDGIKELELVRRVLPSYDHAGASRVLGLLYCLAPGWSPFGDLDKSIKLAQESTRLAPDYALNRLYLADTYKKRGEKEAAIREYQQVLADSVNQKGTEAKNVSARATAMLQSLGYQG